MKKNLVIGLGLATLTLGSSIFAESDQINYYKKQNINKINISKTDSISNNAYKKVNTFEASTSLKEKNTKRSQNDKMIAKRVISQMHKEQTTEKNPSKYNLHKHTVNNQIEENFMAKERASENQNSQTQNNDNSENTIGLANGMVKATQLEIENAVLMKRVSINVKNVPFTYLFSILSSETGIPIVIDHFEPSANSMNTNIPTTTTQSTTSTTNTNTGSSSGSTNIQVGTTQSVNDQIGMVTYFAENQPLKYVLDALCSLYDLSWKYRYGEIIISRFEDAVFTIRLPALEKDINIDNGPFKIIYDKYFFQKLSNLQNSLQALLTNDGGSIYINNMGYVVVRARPSEVRMIGKIIHQINKDMSTTIPIRIAVYLVQLNHQRSLGLDVLNLNIRSTVLGKGLGPSGSVVGNMSLGASNNALTLGISNLSSQGLLEALASQGKVITLENVTLRALNYQPIAYRPQTQQTILSNVQLSYVSSVAPTSTSTGNTGSSSQTYTTPTITTQTSTVSSGSDLVIVPYTLNPNNPNKIVIDLYRNQTSILNLAKYDVNLAGFQNQIILPTTQTNTNIQQSVLKKGETLILLSSVLSSRDLERQGIPFLSKIPVLGYLFGEKGFKNQKYQYVISISYL